MTGRAKAMDRGQSKKACWLARESTRGWRLGLAWGEDKTKYLPFWFASVKDIKKALGMNILFVHMDGSTEPPCV